MSTKQQNVLYFRLIGRLRPDNRLELMPGYLTENPGDIPEDQQSDLVAELFNHTDTLVLRYGVPLLERLHMGKAGADVAVRGCIPFPPSTRLIRFLRSGIPIHEIKVSGAQPTIKLNWKPPSSAGGRETVTWTASHAEKLPLQFFLRYTHDGGKTWRRISSRIEKHTHVVDFAGLPGGARCAIAVVATDGVNTAIAQSPYFAVNVKPCAARITAPQDGIVIPAGRPLCLSGQGYYIEEDAPEMEHLSWESSRDGKLGNGSVLMNASLKPGKHRITLTAGTGKRRGQTAISITVT